MESGGGAAERSSSSGGWGEPRPTPCLTHTSPRQAYIPTGARRGRFDACHDSWELEANLSVGLAAAFRKKRRQQASAPEPRRCAEPPREPVQEAGLDGEGPAAEGVVREAEGLQLHLSARSSTGYRGVSYDARKTGLQAKAYLAKTGKARVYLGSFATAVEAAVCFARYMQQKQVKEDMAEPTTDGKPRQPMTWAQCELCDKWRKLPNLTEDELPDEWYCRMNLDPLHNACNLPEELETGDAEEEGENERPPHQLSATKAAIKANKLTDAPGAPADTTVASTTRVVSTVAIGLETAVAAAAAASTLATSSPLSRHLQLEQETKLRQEREEVEAPAEGVHCRDRRFVRLILTVGEGGSVHTELLRSSSEPVPQKLTPGHPAFAEVIVPCGVLPGQQVKLAGPGGQWVVATVPSGVFPGQMFRVILPATPPPAPQHLIAQSTQWLARWQEQQAQQAQQQMQQQQMQQQMHQQQQQWHQHQHQHQRDQHQQHQYQQHQQQYQQ